MNAISFLISIAPLLLLLALLVSNHYPGEAVIERLRVLIERASARPAESITGSAPFNVHNRSVRGGRLIACSLAGRAPPVPA